MITSRVAGAPLDFVALRDELSVPGDFAPEVLAAARRAAIDVELPDEDATDIPLVTIDPAGSRDLDQAMHLARDGDGYLVSYAIADVGAFVQPGSVLDVESQRRGTTLYFPDTSVPMLPPALSEDAASLVPDRLRPCVLWRIGLSADGEVHAVDVRRARVRSRAQLDYLQIERASALPDAIALLPELGAVRVARARERHAIDLDLPEQIVRQVDGGWRLDCRVPTRTETHNAEISVLTGMCAAQLMLQHHVGIVRVVPEPDARAVRTIRRAARALGIDWPAGAAPGDVLATLDRGNPRHVALIEHAGALLRGARYVAFNGAEPEQAAHAGIAAPYAHATAPLRRLVDRYVSEICLALHAGEPVPGWVRSTLPDLPALMQAADRRGHEVSRAVVDMAEAWVLHDRVGELFTGVVIDADDNAGTIVLDEPAVRARCDGTGLPLGERITVRLVSADVAERTVRFARD